MKLFVYAFVFVMLSIAVCDLALAQSNTTAPDPLLVEVVDASDIDPSALGDGPRITLPPGAHFRNGTLLTPLQRRRCVPRRRNNNGNNNNNNNRSRGGWTYYYYG